MSEWEELSLGDIVKIKGGKRLPKGETLQTEPTNHPYIRVRDMGTRYINRNVLEFVPNEVFDKISRYTVNTGDIIISIVGTIGLISIIDDNLNYASQTENCAKLSGLNQNDSLYLYYFLKSKTGQQRIYQGTVGAVQAKLPLYSINALQVIWPSKNQRSSIAHILGKLDDKIELNRQMNQTLEDMAQALFKSWFVDFDPVFDKALAAGNEIPEALKAKAERRKLVPDEQKLITKNPELAQLFPSQFTFNETLDKWIPEGWEVKTIGDVTSLIIDHRGKTPKKLGGDWVSSGYPAISAKNIKDGRLIREDTIRYLSEDIYRKWMKDPIEKGDIIMTSEAPMGEMFFIGDKTPYCLSQRLYAIRSDGTSVTPYYLYNWLQSDLAKHDLESRCTGTTVTGIKQSELRKVLVITPSIDLLKNFERMCNKNFEKIFRNAHQIKTLTQLRDTLLPQLISGKVRVPEAFVEEMAD